MSLMQAGRGCRTQGLDRLRPTDKAAPLAGDALGPLLAGWLANDVPRAAFDVAFAANQAGWIPPITMDTKDD